MDLFGRTIAVLGGGFNKIYPEENEWLFHKILKNCGCIITEYPPNVEALKKNFPRRNRIVSGIADAVLVVEAEYRSGTSITARYAKEQGKKICCLPSNIDSKCGIGTNRLIQEGARLITKPSEIESIFNNMKANENISTKKYKGNNLNDELKRVYEIILETPININNICKITKKGISEITPILTMLEIEGYIEQLPGNEFKIKE